MSRKATQRLVTLAMAVLDTAAYGSATQKRNSLEVRLALAVLWLVVEDRRWLRAYWWKANNVSQRPWQGCRQSWYGIAATLRAEGWHAPIEADWARTKDAIGDGPPAEHPGFECD